MKNKSFFSRKHFFYNADLIGRSLFRHFTAAFLFTFHFPDASAHVALNKPPIKLIGLWKSSTVERSELSNLRRFREDDFSSFNVLSDSRVSSTLSNSAFYHTRFAPPVVNAGPDQAITLPVNSVTLSGSATDQDGTISSYNWVKVSGGTAVITSPSADVTTVTGLVQGSYVFRLTATDNSGSSASDDVLVTVNSSGNITTFNFTNKPITDPEMHNWGRGAVYWNGTAWDNSQAPTIPEGTSRGKNSFWRFNWSDLEDNNGSYIFYGTWPRLDHYVRQAIDRGEMLHFGGVMPICSACGDHVTSTFADGARMYFPKYIYDSMQRSTLPAWNTGTGLWMPNWNNTFYLERYESLLKAVADYFNTGSYIAQSGPWAGKRVYYKDLLDAVGINGYGDFGEWHNWPYDGQIPSNAMASSQSLKRIIDANRTAFPNTQLITMMASFYNGGSARVPTDVTYHVLTAKNNFGYIGWRRDNIGDRGYGDWLENNPNSYNGMRFDTAIRNRWKYAMITGEPLNGNGSCCPYYEDVRRQVNLYHYAAFGNGNYGSNSQAVWDTMRAVFKITGYRYNLNGGSMTSTLTAGQPFNVSLNWRNVGVAPIYQKRWKVKYELKNASDQIVQSWTSRLQLYLFLPSSADSVLSETFTLNSNIPTGSNYKLTLKLEDTVGLLEPIYLAINSPSRNADGSYTIRTNIAVQEGGINLPPVANAGSDKKLDLPFFSTELRGSGSDPENASLSYQWSLIGGPSNVIIRSPSLPVTSVEGFIAGVYRFQLKVSDPLGEFGLDTVTYFINTPPSVTLGPDKELTLPDNIIQLAATATDSDGSILAYSWDQVSGPAGAVIVSPTSSATRIEGLTEGNYFFLVKVMDDDSAAASDTIYVKVNRLPNRPPLAVAGTDISITLPNNNTQLNASSSVDSDGNIALFNWTVLSGPEQFTFGDANASSTSFYDLVQGNYQVMLTVTDNEGATDTDTLLIQVNPDPNNIAPMANAGADLQITLPLDSVELDGSASSDPDGTIARYHWAYLQGPDRYLIVSSNAEKTVLKDLVFGRYIFLLTITDNRGSTSFDTVEVTVDADPTNKLPLANAGTSAVITLPLNQYQLDGSASVDPDGILIRYEWNQISGPHTALSGATLSQKVLVSNLIKGVYRFSLSVMDNNGAFGQDTVDITVNQPPAANAGADLLLQFPDNDTTLDADGSFDTDGVVTSYRWEWLAGPAQYTLTNADKIRASVSGLSIGTYRFKLLVTDDQGGISDDTITITVNGKPSAKAGPDIELTLPTNVTVLDGNGSIDEDGSIKAYAWSYVSGPSAYKIINPANPATIISDLTNGTYVFSLQVTDNHGAINTDSVTVLVNKAPNRLPVANAGMNFSVYLPDPYIQLNGSGSYDPDGSISSYRWKLVSGAGSVAFSDATASITTVTGVKAGSYTFQLTVQDNEGAVSTTEVTVTVNTPLNKLPVADAGRDTSIVLPYSRVMLNGGRSYDPDGTLIAYSWRQLSGPAGSTLQDANKVLARAIDLVEGSYAFELTVKDNAGAVVKDTMRVNVLNLNRSDDVFNLYPNPAVQQIRVQCQIDAVSVGTISIFAQTGHVLLSQPFRSDPGLFQREINVSSLKPGMYYLEMLIASQKRYIRKFIKQ